jgi:pimeloyl-ACP methyl ester carboxylesterase
MRVTGCEAGAGNLNRALTIPIDDVDIFAVAEGSEPRAIFIHGMGDDLRTWDTVWESPGGEFAALRYDLRGFGRSIPRKHTPFTHANDLLAVLNASGIERSDLIGVSEGGGIAINFALDHPERVGSLILISPHLVAWEFSEEWVRLWNPVVEHARAGKMDEARRLWWEHPLFATTRTSAASTTLYESIMRYSGEQWIDDHHELMLPDVERLHLLKTRTLLLTGGRDLDDFRLIADLIEASAADVKRIDDPLRGHLLHLEDPAGCAKNISAFLSARRNL